MATPSLASPSYHMERVARRLDALRLKAWFLLVAQGVLRWAGAALLLFGAASLLARFSPGWGRMLLAVGWVAGIAFAAVREWKRGSWTPPSREQVAGWVESRHPEAKSRLLSALQLDTQREQAARLGYDPILLEMSIAGGVRTMDNVSAKVVLAEERRGARNALIFAVGSAVILAFLFSARLVTADSLRAWRDAPKQTFVLEIGEVHPGNATVKQGEDVPVRAAVSGAGQSPIVLAYRAPGGEWGELPMTSAGRFHEATLKNIVQPLEYQVRVKETTSPVFAINVATPPVVETLSITLHFPAYTEFGTKTLEPNQGDVTALAGTRVAVSGKSNLALSGVRLDFDELPDVSLKANGQMFSGSFVALKSGRYTLDLKSADGTTNANPSRYTLYAVEDEAPTVRVVAPGKDSTLDDAMTVPLEVEASDDFGVARILLHYTNDKTKESRALPIGTYREPTPVAQARYVWNLSAMNLFPEDTVSYHVEVVDNNTVTGPKRAVSPTYTVRVPSMTELFDELTKSQTAQSEAMESMTNASKEAEGIVEGIIDQLRKEQELTLKDKKELERAKQLQQEMEQKRQELAKELQKAAEEAQKNNLLDSETLQKIEEMQRLLDEVASEELKEAMKKLAEALTEQKMSEQQRKLMEANFNQQEFRQRIEQMTAFLKKLQTQQEVEKALKMAEALVEQQRQIVEKTEELNRNLGKERPQTNAPEAEQSQRLGQQESKVEEGAKGLEEQMQKVGEKLSEEKSLDRVAQEMQRLQQSSPNLQKELNRAQGEFSHRNLQSAQRPATSALQQLQQLRQGLDNANEFMQGAGGEQVMAALQAAIRNSLHLSRSHEKALNDTSKLSSRRNLTQYPQDETQMNQIAVDEQAIAEGTRAVAQALADLTEQDIMINPELVWGLNGVADGVGRGIRALADKELNRALPIQRQTLGTFNETILKMLDAMNNLQAQQQMSGMQGMMEQLQQLAESQGNLNRQGESAEQQMRQRGQTPNGQQSLERMAFEQSLIRQAMQRLSEKLQRAKEVLGDLQGIGTEMKKVEGRLQAAELNREVLERMRQIETRMLESAKSLQRRQTGKERKAMTAKKLFGDQIGTENAEWNKVVEKFRQELSAVSDAEAPEAYRALVRSYFRALAERKAESGRR